MQPGNISRIGTPPAPGETEPLHDRIQDRNQLQVRSESPSTARDVMIWGFTAGLITAEAFNKRVNWPNRLACVAIPINWMIFPFNPLKLSRSDPSSNGEMVSRVALFSFSFLAGLSTTIFANYSLRLLNGSSSYSSFFNAVLFFVQATVLAVNLLASRQLQVAVPQEKRLDTRQLFDWMRNKFNQLRTDFTASTANKSEEEEAIEEPTYPQGDIVPYVPTSSHSNQSETKQRIVSATRDTQHLNKKSKNIFERLEAFIQQDSELREAYLKAFDESQERLLPPYQTVLSTTIPDPDIEAWKQAMHEQSYWDGRTTRVRDFLGENPEFSRLLAQKFEKSAIADKQELFDFFFPIINFTSF